MKFLKEKGIRKREEYPEILSVMECSCICFSNQNFWNLFAEKSIQSILFLLILIVYLNTGTKKESSSVT